MSNPNEKKSSPLAALFKNVVAGGLAAAVEVGVDHPLWTIKTRKQTGQSFTLNLKVLYKGIGPNAVSMMPITALQVGLAALASGDKPSKTRRTVAGVLGGVGAALVASPTEMVMTYQGASKTGFFASAKMLVERRGFAGLFAGLPLTMVRDGIFSAAFLAGAPIITEWVKPYVPKDSDLLAKAGAPSFISEWLKRYIAKDDDLLAQVGGGIGAGLVATVLTQTADAAKAVQQKAAQDRSMTMVEAVKGLYAKRGFAGLFAGGLARGSRVVAAITILSSATPAIKEVLEKRFEM